MPRRDVYTRTIHPVLKQAPWYEYTLSPLILCLGPESSAEHHILLHAVTVLVTSEIHSGKLYNNHAILQVCCNFLHSHLITL